MNANFTSNNTNLCVVLNNTNWEVVPCENGTAAVVCKSLAGKYSVNINDLEHLNNFAKRKTF